MSEPEMRFSGNSSGSKEVFLSEGLRDPKRGASPESARMRFSATAGEEAKNRRPRACGNRQKPKRPVLLRLEWGRLGQMQKRTRGASGPQKRGASGGGLRRQGLSKPERGWEAKRGASEVR